MPGIEGVNLRYGFFYGAETLAPTVALLRKRMLPVPRGGGGVHSYVFLPDAASATVAALERGVADQAYNVCDDRPTAWNDFFDAVARAYGAPRPLRVPSWVFGATPYVRDVLRSSIPMSNAKARTRLGWTPTAPAIEDGLALAVRAGA